MRLKKEYKQKLLAVLCLPASVCMAVPAFAAADLLAPPALAEMASLTDEELADTSGQALFNMSYLAPTDSRNLMGAAGDVGFYTLGVEGKLELNANISNLQLGCGGINGAGGCDVDIKNVGLSGLPTSYDAQGRPVFENGRAATSAVITNPFIEFAFKSPNNPAQREFVGFRLGAAAMSALLTLGTENQNGPSTVDGIQSLSGFMRIKQTTGEATTQAATFGKQPNEAISGLLNALGNDRTFTSEPGSADTLGVTVPSLTTIFNVPGFQVNGPRQSVASISGITTTLASVPLANGPLNQLKVNFDCILVIACSAKVALKAGSAIQNLNMAIDFNQSLSMIHNIPMTGTGGYLSMQGQDLRWPGAYTDPMNPLNNDVARRGWWMSFADQVDLGYLQAQNPVDIRSVFPQVAALMTAELLKEQNRVYAPADAAVGSLFGITIVTPNPIIVDLNAATLANPATLSLSNLQLVNQAVVPNCWGSSKFC